MSTFYPSGDYKQWVYSKDESRVVIDWFSRHWIAVLGWDVYLQDSNSLLSTYDNWYCNKADNESWAEYVARSCSEAMNFISCYSPLRPIIWYEHLSPQPKSDAKDLVPYFDIVACFTEEQYNGLA